MCCQELPKGKRLEITEEVESWGSCVVEGKKIRYKTVVLEVRKIKGGTYAFRSTTIFDDGRPAINAKKKTTH